MEPFLLTTKLRIPPQPDRSILRERLTNALERAISRRKLTLIAAPAGYGKTTLLAQWAHSSRVPVAWLSLGEEDNDLERFLRYLLAAWEEAQPGVMESPPGLLLGAMMPDVEAVLPAVVNLASDMPGPVVLVLDDCHLIDDASIHRALTFLLDHLPPSLHFVLAGREEPPLPIARYRARGELLELRAEDLRFLPEETVGFFGSVAELDLSHDDVMALQTQVEGWIAGLQLAALSLRRPAETGRRAVTGKYRFIADYLSEDVLAPLPDEMQQFMLRVSVLDRLCGPLCNAVTGREDGQAVLEAIERKNLFLVPLDASREWFRFHRLFRDFLFECLRQRHPGDIVHLHRRAARWCLAHDLPDRAFQHAVEGDDVELVGRILERYVTSRLLGGEIRVVQRWLGSLPDAWLSSHPTIGLAQAGVLLVTGQFDASARWLDEVERLARARGDDEALHRARATALRCNIACFENDLARAEHLADRALRELPESDLDFLAGIYGALGDTYRRNGHWQKAQESYRKLLNYTHAPAFRVLAVHVYGALADLSLQQGHLRDAAGYWQQALAAIQARENWGRYPLPLTGWVYIRMSELLYEWDDLSGTWDHLSRGLERAELGGDVRSMIAGYLIAGRARLAEGDVSGAEDYLERARPLVEQTQFAHWISRFERLQLELWLAQDRLRAAVTWVDQMLREAALEEREEGGVAQLAVARVWVVIGDQSATGRALALLERLLQAAEGEDRLGIVIEVLAIQALAQWQRGERAASLIALERALRLAEPHGYVRLFADLGLPMARLLQEAHARGVLAPYAENLLASFPPGLAFPGSAGAALPEPLTGREQEILQLIAAGLTNREIGEALVISPETAKKHASNILGKLGAGNRTEAVARARELNLLD